MISNLISWIVVGLIAGWATGKIMSGKGYGGSTTSSWEWLALSSAAG